MTRRLTLISLITALIFGSATTSSLAKDEPDNLITSFPTLEGLSDEQVEKSIIDAVIGRKWTILKKEGNEIVVNISKPGYTSTLTIIRKPALISIYSDSWTTNKANVKKKRKDPVGWIENLKKDVGVFMSRELYR